MTIESFVTPDTSASDEAMVLIVDDDARLLGALENLFRSVGMRVALFASAAELLAYAFPDVATCLLLDVRLRGQSGLDLQARLAEMGIQIPIIFMTGYGDIPMTVAAMKLELWTFWRSRSASKTCLTL